MIYISIPITGHDEEAQRARALSTAAELRAKYHCDVANPFEVGDTLSAGFNCDPTYGDYMRADLARMLECKAVYMASGWQSSRGCQLEHRVATTCGMFILYEEPPCF